MSFIVVGTNHKFSPIEMREKIAFSKKMLNNALAELTGFKWIKAAVILSTCNRVELYADTSDIYMGVRALKDFLSSYHRLELNKIEPYLYTYIDKEAILHLFSVSSGIDSQIIGEHQILEQVRVAYKQAKAANLTNPFLDTIFKEAERISLKIRQETEISKDKTSIARIVMELIRTKSDFIKVKKILIIGVGKISELVVRHLKKEEIDVVFIANRTYERACQLARYINAKAVGFDRLKEKLKEVDIVISATSSPHLILKKEDLVDVKKPLLIIDLAVPRDVESEARYMEGIDLFCLDDLNFIIEKNLNGRRQQIPNALRIIEKEVENLCLTEYLELGQEPVRLP